MRVRIDNETAKKVKAAMKRNKRKTASREVNMALAEHYAKMASQEKLGEWR